MTAFLQYFWIFFQIGFASKWNPMSSFGKVSQPFCTELVWASLWYFSNFSKFGTRFPDFPYSRPKKCVFGPGNVLACPIFYRFVYQSANVPQTLSDPPQKLIVHTFPSIWQWPFFINILKNQNIFERGIGKIGFCLYCIAYWYCLLAPVTVRVDTKKPPVLDKGTLGFSWFAQNRIGKRQEERGKGGHASSVFLEKHIKLAFSDEYALFGF